MNFFRDANSYAGIYYTKSATDVSMMLSIPRSISPMRCLEAIPQTNRSRYGHVLAGKRSTGGPKGPPAARYGAKTWRWRDLLQHVLQEGTGNRMGVQG